ncbi:TadE family protein [Bifidobacterium leontopitheci]|uniref:Pilus assembly protein TadE n=1 Tax=Bifidobacterium leontopitheci TaxID=2650774 RepID=A0A6I1GPE9_9BIFI|nr:TadE family protein [Bifidobacterium leontopitheci]KAB7789948.1 pilus assembly protein TadE [Bifidobacterium leontopitheci]
MTWLSRHDEGAATAEFAMVLPAVAMVAVVLLGMTRTVVVSMDCQDAASAVAREQLVSGGGDPQATARAVAGSGAAASVSRSGDGIRVTVQCPVLPDPFGVLPTKVTGSATAVLN